MIRSATVPIQISAEAEAYIAELAMEQAFEEMVDHTLKTVAGLRGLGVSVQPPYDLGGDPCIIIEAIRDSYHDAADTTARDWGEWKVATFPPNVCEHFVLV